MSPYFLQLQGRYAKCEESINPPIKINKLTVELKYVVFRVGNQYAECEKPCSEGLGAFRLFVFKHVGRYSVIEPL